MIVILLSADLTVVSRVQGAAARAGLTMRVVSSQTAALECEPEQASLLIIDLGAPLNDIAAIVAHFKSKSPPPRILAFGPHVHEERLAAAREAGCDEVVSRGQFFTQMDALVQK